MIFNGPFPELIEWSVYILIPHHHNMGALLSIRGIFRLNGLWIASWMAVVRPKTNVIRVTDLLDLKCWLHRIWESRLQFLEELFRIRNQLLIISPSSVIIR